MMSKIDVVVIYEYDSFNWVVENVNSGPWLSIRYDSDHVLCMAK